MRVSIFLDPADYAFVMDHCPGKDPVFPFVCAVEALYSVVHKAVGPCVLHNVQLLKGIICPDFHGFKGFVDIDINTNTVILVGKDEVNHYRAIYEEMPADLHYPPEPSSVKGEVLPGDYDFLFHGPMLHTIESITTQDPGQDGMGVLHTACGLKWAKQDWWFDPFVCDGALQMGCQLAHMVKGKASLPSKIKRVAFFQHAQGETVKAYLDFTKMGPLGYVFDVTVYDANHQPICAFEGVESYFRLFSPSS